MAPEIKLKEGSHALHLFYQIEREAWEGISPAESDESLKKLTDLCSRNNEACHPRLRTFVNVGGKADLVFFVLAETLGELSSIQREIEAVFPAGSLTPVFNYLSVTELSEYTRTAEDFHPMLIEEEKLEKDSDAFNERVKQIQTKLDEYQHYRLYPELPDWELMGFYPMSKKREGDDNWYSLDFPTRKRLMGGHARVGKKYAGRISQLITGSTGLDDWEWGVTLMAHQADALKEIVYEMRFDEVTAKYGDFGPFFVNIRMEPDALWKHLSL
jgi:peroxiredoxin